MWFQNRRAKWKKNKKSNTVPDSSMYYGQSMGPSYPYAGGFLGHFTSSSSPSCDKFREEVSRNYAQSWSTKVPRKYSHCGKIYWTSSYSQEFDLYSESDTQTI